MKSIFDLLFMSQSVGRSRFAALMQRYFPLVIIVVLGGYVVLRGWLVPFTHDEVATTIRYARMSIHDIVTYAEPIPNNHILHTLLVKLCTSVFGVHDFAARIPNMVGFFLYAGTSIAFSFRLSGNRSIRIFILCAFLLNTFLLDFFSLARGYALSIDLMLAACYMAYRWLQGRRTGHLLLALLLAVASPYANFTTLNFFASFVGLLALYALQPAPDGKRHLPRDWGLIVLACMVLAALSYLPIKAMRDTDQFSFWGSSGFYKDTVHDLIYMSLYARSYFGSFDRTVLVIAVLLCLFGLFMCFYIARLIFKIGLSRSLAPASFFLLLLLGSISAVILQFHLLSTPYLNARTALFFYPLYVLAAVFVVSKGGVAHPRLAGAGAIVISLLLVSHFAVTANLRESHEWWFDADNRTVLKYLEEEHLKSGKKEPITLDCTWYMQPSLSFYVSTDSLKWIEEPPYHKEVLPESNADYYYAMGDDIGPLLPRFQEVLKFADGNRVLLKRKDTATIIPPPSTP